MTKVARPPALQVPSGIHPELAQFLEGVKEQFALINGDTRSPLDRLPTLKELQDAGLITTTVKNNFATFDSNLSGLAASVAGLVPATGTSQVSVSVGGSGEYALDLTPPPAPTNLATMGMFGAVMLTWDGYAGTALYTEIWRSSSNDRGTATLVNTTRASMYVDYFDTVQTYYYWVRFGSAADVEGDWNALSGTAGTPIDSKTLIEIVADIAARDALTGNFEGRIVYVESDGKLYRYHNGAWTAVVQWSDVNGVVISITDFASGITPVEIVATLPSTGNYQGRIVFLTTNGKLYRWTDVSTTGTTFWVASVATADLTGTINLATQVSGTLTTAFAAAGLINSNVIINANGTLTGAGGGQVLLNNLSGTIAAGQIAANAIVAGKIAALAVTAGTIAAGVVTTDTMTANTINGDRILANSLAADKIVANSITAGQIAAGAINTDELAANAITAAKIAAGQITAGHISVAGISADSLTSGLINAARIAANTITGNMISAANLGAIKAALGDVSAGTINLSGSGWIRSGMTGYNAGGPGWWLGNDAGTHKFSIGDLANSRYMRWTGQLLEVSKIQITDGYLRNSLLGPSSARIATSDAGHTAPVVTYDMSSLGNTSASAKTTTIGPFAAPNYGSGYDRRRFAFRRSDIFMHLNFAGQGGAVSFRVQYRYTTGGVVGSWTTMPGSPVGYTGSFAGDNRGSHHRYLRFTSSGATNWDQLELRVSTDSDTLSLAVRADVQNTEQSVNADNSFSTNSGTSILGSAPIPPTYNFDPNWTKDDYLV